MQTAKGKSQFSWNGTIRFAGLSQGTRARPKRWPGVVDIHGTAAFNRYISLTEENIPDAFRCSSYSTMPTVYHGRERIERKWFHWRRNSSRTRVSNIRRRAPNKWMRGAELLMKFSLVTKCYKVVPADFKRIVEYIDGMKFADEPDYV